MDGGGRRLPPGVVGLRRLRGGRDLEFSVCQASVLVITFVAYALFHMSRKPPSIVKSVLDPEGLVISSLGSGHYMLLDDAGEWRRRDGMGNGNGSGNGTGESGWAPFDGESGKNRLGEVDVAFLASYAFGMYFAGHLGDRVDLRLLLSAGMLGSAVFVCLFGVAQFWNIHRLEYFLIVQMVAGLFQATGWPSVVTIVGHWFGKRKRGLIMGIWNAHTSVGNILGSLIAAAALNLGWGWSFIIPGAILAAGGVLVWSLLVVDPRDLGLPSPNETEAGADSAQGLEPHDELARLLDGENKSSSVVVEPAVVKGDDDAAAESVELVGATKQGMPELHRNEAAVGFLEAWRIPGVATFALCLFFSKLVAYTFLYWLPFYIRQTPIAGKILDEKTAGQLSTLFDFGGVVGGILAGHLSDKLNARAITAAGFMYCAIPSLFLYRAYGGVNMTINITLMVVAGVLINGPYALITTAVSADLGTHSSLQGNGRAMATVTAIIDGTGSIGAAVGPLLTGYLSGQGWGAVFIMLMVAALFAGLLLTKLVVAEVVEIFAQYQRLETLADSARQELADLLLGEGSK